LEKNGFFNDWEKLFKKNSKSKYNFNFSIDNEEKTSKSKENINITPIGKAFE
jgi:hypothetical protein